MVQIVKSMVHISISRLNQITQVIVKIPKSFLTIIKYVQWQENNSQWYLYFSSQLVTSLILNWIQPNKIQCL